MRCRACDYELWHCTGRKCPECGSQFTLAEYEFKENAVLFHCPHCDHGVEGDGEAGKPFMSLTQCAVCGLEVNHETFIIRPKVGVDISSFGSLLPIRLKNGNWFTRYFSTVWLIMTRPQTAISRVPVQEPLLVAWKFMLTSLLITAVAWLLPMAFFFIVGSSTSSSVSDTLVVLAFSLLKFFIVFSLVALFAISWALFAHALLQITGGSTFTIRRTVQAVLYGGATSIVGIVPCLGSIASFIWWIIATTNMITRGQRVSGGRASFATLLGSISFFIFVCGGYVLLIIAVTAPLAATARARAAVRQQQIQQQQQPELEPPEEELLIE